MKNELTWNELQGYRYNQISSSSDLSSRHMVELITDLIQKDKGFIMKKSGFLPHFHKTENVCPSNQNQEVLSSKQR